MNTNLRNGFVDKWSKHFDSADLNGVISPFGAGCATIAEYPYLEGRSPHPRAVLGMFDVSARPCVPAHALSFAVPIGKFIQMVENMDESFLITGAWAKVLRRIAGAGNPGSGTISCLPL